MHFAPSWFVNGSTVAEGRWRRTPPYWNGLLMWSLTNPSGTNPQHALSKEVKKCFLEAMQAITIDVVKMMKDIILVMKTQEDVLQSQDVTLENTEGILVELQ